MKGCKLIAILLVIFAFQNVSAQNTVDIFRRLDLEGGNTIEFTIPDGYREYPTERKISNYRFNEKSGLGTVALKK